MTLIKEIMDFIKEEIEKNQNEEMYVKYLEHYKQKLKELAKKELNSNTPMDEFYIGKDYLEDLEEVVRDG